MGSVCLKTFWSRHFAWKPKSESQKGGDLSQRRLLWRAERLAWAHLTVAGTSDSLSRQHPGAPGAPASLRLGLKSGDYGGGLSGGILPAVEHLPGPDKDARPGRGDAVPRNIEISDIAVARLRSGQHAEDSEMLGERDARAARTRGEDKDARRGSTRDTQLELRHATAPVLVATRAPTGFASNVGRSGGTTTSAWPW